VRFASWLAPHFERFVALKRAGGATYSTQEQLLAVFDRRIRASAPKPPLRREVLLDYLSSLAQLFPRSRENTICVVWPALAFAKRHGAAVELVARPLPPSASLRKKRVRIVTQAEFEKIFAATTLLKPGSTLRPATAETLLGLLFATGLRIGEALALDIQDVDLNEGLLTIRRGKFGKSRILPVRASTARALERYILHPRRRIAATATMPVFVSGQQRRLTQVAALAALRIACRLASIDPPYPRLHDLRHSFVVLRMAEWYREGRDVEQLLPLLSTYLGHVSVENTRAYMSSNGLLLEQAAVRFARKTSALDEVCA
jgi:integrase